ncbi:MAG TPA: carboxypeptidase-like regulatory domain-containing protein [Gemmatimonadaceae bacterium]|nr:carboxypeptidase-like regulatory domain-containing protein [Gemmatimonadaceae bacterium]
MMVQASTSQTPTAATVTLTVVVIDPQSARVPGAYINVRSRDRRVPARDINGTTSGAGTVQFEGILPGHYIIDASHEGFRTEESQVRVDAQHSTLTITLSIQELSAEVTVAAATERATNPQRDSALAIFLTQEEIDALPDDPAEMEQVLKLLAPPGAVIRVDGFMNSQLPPKSQIRSIRIPRMDQLLAEFHGSAQGIAIIDVVTRPGLGPLRAFADFGGHGAAFEAADPIAGVSGPSRAQHASGSIGGTLKREKMSAFVSEQIFDESTPVSISTISSVGAVTTQVVMRPTLNSRTLIQSDVAMGADTLLRASYALNMFDVENQGVGGYDLPSRAYSTATHEDVVRLAMKGTVRNRSYNDFRFEAMRSTELDASAVEGPTFRVLGAFTQGGAQRDGETRSTTLSIADDFDIAFGRHAFRVGIASDATQYNSSVIQNTFGTYTYGSIADYLNHTPLSYSQVLGAQGFTYSYVTAAGYIQDELGVTPNIHANIGVRLEHEREVRPTINVQPRVVFVWSEPNGRTAIRTGVGLARDWISSRVFNQAALFASGRAREIDVIDPPDPFVPTGAGSPLDVYLIDPNVSSPRVLIGLISIERRLGPRTRVSATFTRRTTTELLRGINANAPGPEGRPDPQYANVIIAVADAAARSTVLSLSLDVTAHGRLGAITRVTYTFDSSTANTTGAFDVPPTGNLSTEWGPSGPRHRVIATSFVRPTGKLSVIGSVRVQSPSFFNITTGFDDNHDGIFNDRPVGTPRNAGLTPWQFDVGLTASYSLLSGSSERKASTKDVSGRTGRRVGLHAYGRIQNLTNRANYVGFVGVLRSPIFGQPTAATSPFRLDLGVRLAL